MSIPTTDEMDGIFTEEDRQRKYLVWYQCTKCSDWSRFDIEHKRPGPCQHCGSTDLDVQSATSDRTYDPVRAKKRKIMRKKK